MSFYVYQHRRNDTGAVFYVGKGRGKRMLNSRKRNMYWQRIVAKHGFTPEILTKDIDEELAFLVEQEAIDVYRRRGIALANMTEGGEGTSGYRHTESHRRKLRGNMYGSRAWGTTFKGKTHSDEQKELWRSARKGVDMGKWKGRKRSEENKANLSAAKIGVPNLALRKLTAEQVREIRRLLPNEYIAQIARLYSVGESTIRRIRDGVSYKDIR